MLGFQIGHLFIHLNDFLLVLLFDLGYFLQVIRFTFGRQRLVLLLGRLELPLVKVLQLLQGLIMLLVSYSVSFLVLHLKHLDIFLVSLLHGV